MDHTDYMESSLLENLKQVCVQTQSMQAAVAVSSTRPLIRILLSLVEGLGFFRMPELKQS
ncbi:hypothetical protein [Sporosarcina luteola]|uniref:hypothetical protein n=1 Tax=Sporosarcina luteola TaxID=582850 RepID=UPI00203C5EA7|nr:hypothetical protein [Sporosarcina luteola]MCM3709682.1 hypothetical protein [Sporosarcina luteola]